MLPKVERPKGAPLGFFFATMRLLFTFFHQTPLRLLENMNRFANTGRQALEVFRHYATFKKFPTIFGFLRFSVEENRFLSLKGEFLWYFFGSLRLMILKKPKMRSFKCTKRFLQAENFFKSKRGTL